MAILEISANSLLTMKLFDYLASSKPIIVSSLPVLREVLKDKKKLYFFLNNLNIYQWKLAIQKLSNNFSLREIISKNNFFLSKKYNYNLRVKKMFQKFKYLNFTNIFSTNFLYFSKFFFHIEPIKSSVGKIYHRFEFFFIF